MPFVVSLLKGAFPDLAQWNWDMEVQRVHRFPMVQRRSNPARQEERPRAILIYIGNFLLRQAIIDKARPDAKRTYDGHTFFARPDFCHATVERRWRLRQLITAFQGLGCEAYLLFPARLKVIDNGRIRMFSSEVKAQEFMTELKEAKGRGEAAR